MSRGVYRGIHSALLDDPDYQHLSADARLVLLTARLCKDAGAAVIFRYYSEVLCRQTGLPRRRLEVVLAELAKADWLYTDAAASVLWVRNGLRHDPQVRMSDPKHRKAVDRQLDGLPRTPLVARFCKHYGIVRATNGPSEAGSVLLSDTDTDTDTDTEKEKETEAPARPAPGTLALGASATTANGAAPTPEIPPTIAKALERAPLLGPSLRDAPWWLSEMRANPTVDHAAELLKAEAWCRSNPERAPRKRPRAFLHRWFAKAEAGP